MRTLYLVATPIGNLDDISARALHILREVNLIAAEDTRKTRQLLTHFGIHTPLTSYHEHNKLTKLEKLLIELSSGDVALVSEAGTPGLNDPGYELVQAAIKAGYEVSPVPGPSAPVAALVASGLPTNTFLYLGYLPRKSGERRQLLRSVVNLPYTLIFLEAPHRLLLSLVDLREILGNRNIAIARELTKLHEEIYRGTLEAAQEKYATQAPRGEFTLIVSGCIEPGQTWSRASLEAALRKRLAEGGSLSKIAAEAASISGWPRRKVYQLLTEIRNS